MQRILAAAAAVAVLCLFVAGCALPSSPFHGPIILPFQFAIVQVQSPEASITLYGSFSR